MLYALENLLRNAIDAALPNTINVLAGPYTPSGSGAVVVHARDLEIPLPPVDSEGEDPARLIEMTNFSASGTTRDFVIPAALTGAVVEVEAPPGVTVRPGDTYYLENRTIHFYRPPPAAAQAVRVRLERAAAAGWTRRRACSLHLDIAAWAQSATAADQRLEIALHVALGTLVNAPNFDAALVTGADVWMRLLAPRVWLVALRRGINPQANLMHTTAELVLRAELDEIVARGAPAPQGIIERLAGSLTVNRPGTTPSPEPFEVEPADDGS